MRFIPKTTELGIADKIAWKYLIIESSVVGDWDFFSSNYEYDVDETKKCMRGIKNVGIDWVKTYAVSEDCEIGFDGTFCENDNRTTTIVGNLVLKNGKSYRFGKVGHINLNKVMDFVLANSNFDESSIGI